MLLTVFLAIAFCAAITLMLLSAVVFIQDKKFFSSAPQEAQAVIRPRTEELFYGARTMGWVLMVISILTIIGVGVVSIWDGFNLKSQLLKLLVIFPAASALAAWVCTIV